MKAGTEFMRRISALLACAVTAAALLAGCGQTAKQAAEQTSAQETYKFTDQAGNAVEVKAPVERMVVLQHHSLDIICQLGGQDKIVGVESTWQRDLGDYIADIWPAIKEMKTPGTLSQPNIEEIAALKPDIVIVASQSDQASAAKLREMGIPVAVISLRGEGKQAEAQNPRLSNADKAYTDGLHNAIEILGHLTGRDAKAKELWAFAEESRAIVEKAVGDIPDAERVTAIPVSSKHMVYGNDKYVGCMLLRAGAVNPAAKDIQGNGEYNVESLAKWNPDVIISQDRYPEVYKELTTDPAYAQLRAVQNGNVINAPYWAKPWGNPDADSVALGELWLAHMFYPSKVSADVVLERAKAFYETFYGVPFTGTVDAGIKAK
ncbi:periplasmic binding protein [Selenomonas sp. oral taxon 137 str. F0430]|uniref:ABC transporter substrate-binding protein n=1 Tax=Selenomonas sp. oral taxon 137 TaxID=712531 RepID=UPI0001EB2797|nr:ABC transporter substrate-binding protein [Selenomonas sp. oral taxon 137]EFR41543.1 periplasmic binding protein [Selenomonas sp. oral taxon 137 str. F0430]